MIVEFCAAMNRRKYNIIIKICLRREYTISLGNILFKERASHLDMYLFDLSKIHVDCLTWRLQRKFLRDIEVIHSKQCITQHKPLVFDFVVVKVKDTRKSLNPGEL